MITPLDQDQIEAMLKQSPFISFLGLTGIAYDADKQEVVMGAPMRPEFEREFGSRQWHGGPIASIIDTVGD
jgi:acyl-coenzyme A thioesterase PaaI-like protein